MALFPCDANGHRYPGAQRTIYVSVVQGLSTVRRKARLCPKHFSIKYEQLLEHCQDAQIDFDLVPAMRCYSCGGTGQDMQTQFYATVYQPGHDRADYWCLIHDGCVPAVLEDWALDVEEAQTAIQQPREMASESENDSEAISVIPSKRNRFPRGGAKI